MYKEEEIIDNGEKIDLMSKYTEDLSQQGSLVRYRRDGQYFCTDHLLAAMDEHFDELKFISIIEDEGKNYFIAYLRAKNWK